MFFTVCNRRLLNFNALLLDFFIEFMIFAVYMSVTGVICVAAKKEYAGKILCFSGIYAIAIWILMIIVNAY